MTTYFKMISQADIIKTLINKNCTDESVMATALSPHCTPPKLLEKLMESERFDLALDVSMKLGLDVIPLWRTWAMRCLQNRNFQGAREKFRHCFLRLRLPGGRISPMQGKLLSDITKELSKMTEKQITLAEEVKLIKKGNYSFLNGYNNYGDNKTNDVDETNNKKLANFKTKIYSECLYYLKEYGNIEDNINFYIKNSLWNEAIKVLLDEKTRVKINLEKYFIPEILLYVTSRGCLHQLIRAFLDLDSNIIFSFKYFKAIYEFCLNNRRYNLLYYIQNSIGDYIAAAQTQINFFFLNKLAQSYRELNQNLSSLKNAIENYREYLKKLDSNDDNNNERNKTKSKDQQQEQQVKKEEKVSPLFSSMSKNDVIDQIELLTLQIDIIRNFALNEVTGCINGIELDAIEGDNEDEVEDNKEIDNNEINSDKCLLACNQKLNDLIPVTLFDRDKRRKTFLAALVLIYYDLTCSSYFSKNGLDLANKIIHDHGLNKVNVFKTAMKIIIEDESCDILENASLLLERINEDYIATSLKVVSNKDNNNKKRPTSINQSTTSDRQQQQSINNHNNKTSLVNVVRHNSNSNQSITINTNSGAKNDKKTRSLSVAGTISSTNVNNLALKQQQQQNQNQSISPNLTTFDEENIKFIDNNSKDSDKNLLNSNLTQSRHISLQSSVSPVDGARAICDEVIKDSIGNCREVDYKMELAKLLSPEAKIELYIELGKLSNAQTLAFNMNRPDYVTSIIEEAAKLNQNHVKTVCQLWLAKHETGNVTR